MQSTKRWNLLEILNTTTQYFTEKNIDNPRLNAEELLGKALDYWKEKSNYSILS